VIRLTGVGHTWRQPSRPVTNRSGIRLHRLGFTLLSLPLYCIPASRSLMASRSSTRTPATPQASLSIQCPAFEPRNVIGSKFSHTTSNHLRRALIEHRNVSQCIKIKAQHYLRIDVPGRAACEATISNSVHLCFSPGFPIHHRRRVLLALRDDPYLIVFRLPHFRASTIPLNAAY
jgi:hypothetical protein